MASVYTVILAGGAGSRLWPLSRETYPKQMFKLDDNYTLFQKTFLRAASVIDDKNIITATNVKHASSIKQQLKELQDKFCRKKPYTIVTDPIFRNTAPALTLAVKYIRKKTREFVSIPIIIVLPSDHVITDRIAFAEFIEKGINLAKNGYIVTYGQETNTSDENFGYIKARKNKVISEIEPDALKVSQFIEKPKTKEEKEKLKGKLYVNTGIYIFNLSTYLEEAEKYGKEILNIINEDDITEGQPSIPLKIYEKLPNISIDYLIMEKTKKLVTIPFNIAWNDMGSWDAIYDISEKDRDGNYKYGKAVGIDTKDTLIYSTSKLVGAVGLKNKIIAETEDAILIADRKKPNGVKKIYKKLNGKNATAKEIHKTVYRPWGYYEVLEEGEGFLSKCITVNPKSKLSLQRHQHRSEHWVIVEGTATVVKDDKIYTLTPGKSIDIAQKEVHSLQNMQEDELKVIEIQQGEILDENDIERLEDIYGRV